MRIFRAEGRLLPEYVPERAPHRESELNTLLDEFSGLYEDGISGQMALIYGRVGVGKTMLAKKLAGVIGGRAWIHGIRVFTGYANARILKNPHDIVVRLLDGLDSSFPKRGYDVFEGLPRRGTIFYGLSVEAMCPKVEVCPLLVPISAEPRRA